MNKNSHIINVSLSMALVAQSLSRDCDGEGSEKPFLLLLACQESYWLQISSISRIKNITFI